MTPIARYLTRLGQALAAMALYGPAHPQRAAARARVTEALHAVLAAEGALHVTFLAGDVVVRARPLDELRGWNWSHRFDEAGIQRLEADDAPLPTAEQVGQYLDALAERLALTGDAARPPIRVGGLRAGGVHVRRSTAHEDAVASLLDAIGPIRLDEEAAAVRWIHDVVARARPVPLAEVETVVRSLSAAMHRDQHVLLPLLELKTADQYTTTHSCNVATLAMGLAEQLDFGDADVRGIGTAALLHDIGKVCIPPELLVKPGRLTEAEYAVMQQHATEGARILSGRGRGHALAAIVAYEHHVWEDGSRGYPRFHYPRRCHVASRIVHVCDLYDALGTARPYRDAWAREDILAFLRRQSGTEVDGAIVTAFERLLEAVPAQRVPLTEVAQRDWTASVGEALQEFQREVGVGAG
jgi:putative nucleotidyltransferase with HDIG domain